VVVFAGDSPNITRGGAENVPISLINKLIMSADLEDRYKVGRRNGGLCQQAQGGSGKDLVHCKKGDQLHIISGEPVPYAYGVEFLFTQGQNGGAKGHGSPIDGLVDAIIENRERVIRSDKGKQGVIGVYEAIGDGLLLENKAAIQHRADFQLHHRADFHVSHRDRRPLA
jgi:hypothetical protein